MIIDSNRNAAIYKGIGARIQKALAYLAKTDFTGVAPGRYELDGGNVFALVQEYETKPPATGIWEAHRRYIDVQFVAAGIETMGYAPIGSLSVTQPYSSDGDCVLLAGTGDFVTARAGTFVVFFPDDAHMPCLACGAPASVRKVVVKVAVES